MAGVRGFAGGLLAGFNTVDQAMDRRKARQLQAQREADAQARYQQQIGLRQDEDAAQADYRQARLQQNEKAAKTQNEHWNKKYGLKVATAKHQQDFEDSKLAADTAYRNASLALKKDAQKNLSAYRAGQLKLGAARVASSQQKNKIAADKARLEKAQIERKVAGEQRAAREAANKRYTDAGLVELKQNGATPKFVKLMQAGGVDVSQYLNPEWQRSSEVIQAGLQGAPVKKSEFVNAANTYFHNNINRVVGSKTKNGGTIISAKLANVVPSQDGQSVHLGLKVYAKGKNGQIHEYHAPVTSDRSSDDDMVLDVPMKKAIGHIHARNTLNRAMDQKQLATSIKEAQILDGAGENESHEGRLVKAGNNRFINNKTGKVTTLKPIADPGKRRAKAVDLASKEIAAEAKNPRNHLTDAQKNIRLQHLIAFYNHALQGDSGDAQVVMHTAQHGDVTQADIQKTMATNHMTRAQVIDQLQGHG